MRPLLVLLLLASPAVALEPADIFVLANRNDPASKRVAEHYLTVRKVPADHLILLDLPAGEEISRADYDAKLAGPLRTALAPRREQVRCLLTVYGVPIRVGPKQLTDAEKTELDTVTKELAAARAAGQDARRLVERELALSAAESQAAVDSELMLLWWPTYPLAKFQPNPLHWQFPEAKRRAMPPALLTARLDGPTPDIAMRLVDDAVAVEAAGGLSGKVYVDARGIKLDKPDGYGYAGYDESFRETAALLKAGGFDVTLDDKSELFAAKSGPDAAIYTGWYALADYRPCCTFVRGAVAWHLASAEAVTLRPGSKCWCPNLLADGAAVTLGPVSEPYTVGFPKPAEFFGFLACGKYTLAEVHGRTTHFASWMMTCVGDPLYRPFGASPKVKEADVKPSPKGTPILFR